MASLMPICTILASCPLSKALCSLRNTHNSASQVSRAFLQANWVIGSTPLFSINYRKRNDIRGSNTLANTDFWCYGNLSQISNRGDRWTLEVCWSFGSERIYLLGARVSILYFLNGYCMYKLLKFHWLLVRSRFNMQLFCWVVSHNSQYTHRHTSAVSLKFISNSAFSFVNILPLYYMEIRWEVWRYCCDLQELIVPWWNHSAVISHWSWVR